MATEQSSPVKPKISSYQRVFGVGPLGLLISLILLLILSLLDRMIGHPAILSQPRAVRIFGLILIAAWICWHVWCLKTIRTWWQEDQLCTQGPFRIVRHPIYAGGGSVGFLGIALLFNSWVVLLCPFLIYPLYSILVRKEERMMESFFGEEYRQYAARTGRLFPRLF